MPHAPTHTETEELRHPTEQEARQLRAQVFDAHGTHIFQDEDQPTIDQWFQLLLTKLKDMRLACGDTPTADELAPELKDSEGNLLDILSPENISRFAEFAQIARREIEASGFDPDFFVSEDCIDLAHHLLEVTAPESELIT